MGKCKNLFALAAKQVVKVDQRLAFLPLCKASTNKFIFAGNVCILSIHLSLVHSINCHI
jgi:hypothetical protein